VARNDLEGALKHYVCREHTNSEGGVELRER
jgi:hypothetical protein